LTTLILVVGVLIVFVGVIILVKPNIIFGYLRRNQDKLGIYLAAVAVRLVIGVLLVIQSKQSGFPIAIEALGWLSIVAAIGIAIMGRRVFASLITWALKNFARFQRIGGIIAMIFGGFIIYAFV